MPFEYGVISPCLRHFPLQAPIDKHTKLLVASALGLVGVSGLIITAAATLRSLQERIQETAKDAILSAAFVMVVFLVARGILDSP